MKRASLIAGTVFATAITLLSLGGPAALAHAGAMSSATFARQVLASPLDHHAMSDVTLALSDLVDVEKVVRTTSTRERSPAHEAFSRRALSQVHDGLRVTDNR